VLRLPLGGFRTYYTPALRKEGRNCPITQLCSTEYETLLFLCFFIQLLSFTNDVIVDPFSDQYSIRIPLHVGPMARNCVPTVRCGLIDGPRIPRAGGLARHGLRGGLRVLDHDFAAFGRR
jgi:hypothetical protein